MRTFQVSVGVSNRHLHLSENDIRPFLAKEQPHRKEGPKSDRTIRERRNSYPCRSQREYSGGKGFGPGPERIPGRVIVYRCC